jgi:lysozyme
VPTIGYGHTSGVKDGDTCTPAEATNFLIDDLATAEAAVNQECTNINQNQFDALVSFVFNVGVGAFKRSTLLKCVQANPQNQNIAYEFSRWNKAGGQALRGLIRRRKEEAELYFDPI